MGEARQVLVTGQRRPHGWRAAIGQHLRVAWSRGSARSGAARSLVYGATVLSLGHHLDHVIRGNHTGWPLTDQVTPFTYSLGVYPLILLGLCLSTTSKAGRRYWMLLSGAGALFLAATHLGPSAVEPPGDIINQYPNPLVGRLAFAWLLCLLLILVVMFAHHTHHLWHQARRQKD